MFSIYRSARDTSGIHTISLDAVYERVIIGAKDLDVKTEECRRLAIGDKDVYREYKANNLPAVTFAGTFTENQRNANGLLRHSGYVIVDIDGCPSTEEVADLIVELSHHPNIKMLFVSPSNLGLKALVPVDPLPTNAVEHEAAWRASLEIFESFNEIHTFTLDISGKDLPRLCFLSHDPTAILRPETVPVRWTLPEPPSSSSRKITYDVDHKEGLRILSHIPCGKVVGELQPYDVWLQVGMALKEVGADVSMWDEWSQTDQRDGQYKPGVCQNKWETFKRSEENQKKVGWTRLVELAKVGGYKPPSGKQKKKRDNPIPRLKDASEFFIHDQFNVLAMAEHIQKKYVVWADDSGLFIYDEMKGVYCDGKHDIALTTRCALGKLQKKSYVEETVACLMDTCRRDVPDDAIDSIAFRNGVLKLNFDDGDIGTFSEHSPENYLKTTFPVDYDPDVSSTEGSSDFIKWLSDILADDEARVRLLFEVIGSIFHKGSVDMQSGVLFIGEGGTGKSMLLKQIQQMVGVENVNARAWTDYGRDDFAFGSLYEKHLALDSDIQVDVPLNGAIKPCITGNVIRYNEKYAATFDFKPYATWIGAINREPTTRDRTWGFFRRWLPIHFNKRFKTDVQFERRKLKLWSEPQTMSRIVLECLTLYVMAFRNGGYSIPESVSDAQQDMFEGANTIAVWLATDTEPDATSVVTRAEAYQAYVEFCQAKSFVAESTRNFYSVLRGEGYNVDDRKSVNGKVERVIIGFYLK